MRNILTHDGSSKFELKLLSVFYNVKYNVYCGRTSPSKTTLKALRMVYNV